MGCCCSVFSFWNSRKSCVEKKICIYLYPYVPAYLPADGRLFWLRNKSWNFHFLPLHTFSLNSILTLHLPPTLKGLICFVAFHTKTNRLFREKYLCKPTLQLITFTCILHLHRLGRGEFFVLLWKTFPSVKAGSVKENLQYIEPVCYLALFSALAKSWKACESVEYTAAF